MSDNCKEHSVPCGCKDTGIVTPPPCGDGIECPDANPCSETFDGDCVFYTGDPILCGDDEVVPTNTPLSEALDLITAYFCTTSGHALPSDLLCGDTVVAAEGSSIDDTFASIVSYFCTYLADNLMTSTSVNTVDAVDIDGCTTRSWTITFLAGATEITNLVMSTPPICPPVDVCGKPSVATPEDTDEIVICREVFPGNVDIRKLTYGGLTDAIQLLIDNAIAELGLYAQTANSVPVVDPILGSLIGAGEGSLLVGANTFQIGDSYRAKLAGHITCSNTQELSLLIRVNGVTIASTGLIDLKTATDNHWNLDIDFTIRTLGATGNVAVGGKWTYIPDASGQNFEGEDFTAIGTIDTTVANTLDIVASFNLNEGGVNSIYSELFTLNKNY